MPTCKHCLKEIDYLDVRRQDWRKVKLDDNNKKLEFHNLDWSNGFRYSFRCPKCYRYLFYSPKQAIKFLRKGINKRYTTKW